MASSWAEVCLVGRLLWVGLYTFQHDTVSTYCSSLRGPHELKHAGVLLAEAPRELSKGSTAIHRPGMGIHGRFWILCKDLPFYRQFSIDLLKYQQLESNAAFNLQFFRP